MRSRAFVRSILAVTVTVAALGCVGDDPTSPSVPASETFAAALGVNLASMTKVDPDLYIQDVVAGTGASAVRGDSVLVVYSGFLANGSQFDSNVGQALFGFRLGKGVVITGWDLGVVGMKVGGKRKLVIGSSYGYGARGGGGGVIPPHATLVFDVELKTIIK